MNIWGYIIKLLIHGFLSLLELNNGSKFVIIGNIITAQGKLTQYNSNVLLAIIFETINDAQNIPTSIAYKSVFFKSLLPNIQI